MDFITVIIIAAAIVIVLLLCILLLRRRRLNRYTVEAQRFTHDVLSKRLRALNDQVRHCLFHGLEVIHTDADGTNAAEHLAAVVVAEVFGSAAEDWLVNIADVRTRLEQSPTLLHHCKVHAERTYATLQNVVRDKVHGNIFRGPHQKLTGDAASQEEGGGGQNHGDDDAGGDLDVDRPHVSGVYCCCCCIFESTEREALRDHQLLYFYAMAHRMCCARSTASASPDDASIVDMEMQETGDNDDEDEDDDSPNTVGLLRLDIVGVPLRKMLHPGNLIARQLVEITAHAKQLLKVSPPPVSAAATAASPALALRAIVDVAPAAKTMYSRSQSVALLADIFEWRALSAFGATEGGPSLGRDLNGVLQKVSAGAGGQRAWGGNPNRLDALADTVQRRRWVTAAQDRHFFAANGLRDDLFAYFANLRRALLLTANTDKQVMGMYDAVRIFDVSTKMWMLAASKTIVATVAAEWEKRVLQRARKIAQDGRREALLLLSGGETSALDMSVTGGGGDVGGDGEAEGEAAAASATAGPTASSFSGLPTTQELLASVLQSWLDELHDSFSHVVAVPAAKRGACCRRCVPAYPSVTARLPDTEAAIAKALQGKLRAAAMHVLLSEEQKLEAVARAAPIRERLVDCIFPQGAAGAGGNFSPREGSGSMEADREQQGTPQPPPPPDDPPPHGAGGIYGRPPTPPPRERAAAAGGGIASTDDIAIDLARLDGPQPRSDEEATTERSLIILAGLRDAVSEVKEFIEEAMAKIELEIAEKLVQLDETATGASGGGGVAPSSSTLKAYLKFVKKSADRIVLFAAKHLSLMVDCSLSSRALCAAAQAGRSTSEAFKARLQRFQQQLVEFAANRATHAAAAKHRLDAGLPVLLLLSEGGFVLGGAATYTFVPMREVVATYNFHAARFPELPQGLSL